MNIIRFLALPGQPEIQSKPGGVLMATYGSNTVPASAGITIVMVNGSLN